MSSHNICFHGEIRKISIFWIEKSTLTIAMNCWVKISADYILKYFSQKIRFDTSCKLSL